MNYRSLIAVALVSGLVVGLALFGVISAMSDSFKAQVDLQTAGIYLFRGPGGLFLVLGIAIGWLVTAACSRFTAYAGLALLPPLVLFLGVTLLTIVGLTHETLPDDTRTLDWVACFTVTTIGVSATFFEWLNL